LHENKKDDEELEPEVAQFIKEFNLYVDSLSDAQSPQGPDEPDQEPGPMDASGGTHRYPLILPVSLWHELQREVGKGSIASFIRLAIEEKLGRLPDVHELVVAARGIARIVDEMPVTADVPAHYGERELRILLEILTKFERS
jgi:hypothetical protein